MNKFDFKLFIAFLCFPIVVLAQNDQLISGKNGMVATAHPLATQAAIEIMEKGGNAIDAAVAAAFAIGVVEPDGSGIGGGGGMVIFLKEKNQSFYINYYVKSPEGTPSSFNTNNDKHNGKSICIPGTVAGLTLAQEKFGVLPLADILKPAIKLAENGFPIDRVLGSLILDNFETLSIDANTAFIYMNEGFPKMEGDILIQPDLANTLIQISENGRDGFYKGQIAESIVNGVKKRGGYLSLDDMRNYEPIISSPEYGTYRGFDVLSARAPQAGISIIEGLNILENYDLKKWGHYATNAQTLHVMAETLRKVYTDRYYFIGDPTFFDVPTTGLTSKDFARERYSAINQFYPDPKLYRDTEMGNPWRYVNEKSKSVKKKKQIYFGDEDDDFSSDDTDSFDSWGKPKKAENGYVDSVYLIKPRVKQKRKKKKTNKVEVDEINEVDIEFDGSTTHICIIDKDGNAVSLTQTLGTFFGSAQTVSGVLLNCGMSNFSSSDNPNILAGGKQPRSSIAPTIILQNNHPVLIIGSPGGSRIIASVLEVIVNVLDFDMNVEEANRSPRFYTQKWEDYLHLEYGIQQEVIDDLIQMNHNVRVYNGVDLFFGGVQMIIADPLTGTYYGSADIRRGGKAQGY